MGASGHRLLAVFLTFALTLLMRPSGAFAADGPVAVSSTESSDISLHTPRRAATSLDNDLRGFVSPWVSDILPTGCSPAPSVELSLPRWSSSHAVRSRAWGRAHPRGPPLG